MTARYLLRFDDVCDTMNWRVWDQVEGILDSFQAKPIMAVVPDNHDSDLMVDARRSDFWARVRDWSARGYSIAMHGCQHLCTSPSGGLLGLNETGEFAGLPRAEQMNRVQTGLAIFRENGVTPRIWIAPRHSLDHETLSVVREVGFECVSDGFFFESLVDRHGIRWLPQQLWKFRWMPAGLWTVCLHINAWQVANTVEFARQLQKYSTRLTTVDRELERLSTAVPRTVPWEVHRAFLALLRGRHAVRVISDWF